MNFILNEENIWYFYWLWFKLVGSSPQTPLLLVAKITKEEVIKQFKFHWYKGSASNFCKFVTYYVSNFSAYVCYNQIQQKSAHNRSNVVSNENIIAFYVVYVYLHLSAIITKIYGSRKRPITADFSLFAIFTNLDFGCSKLPTICCYVPPSLKQYMFQGEFYISIFYFSTIEYEIRIV